MACLHRDGMSMSNQDGPYHENLSQAAKRDFNDQFFIENLFDAGFKATLFIISP